MLWRPRQPSNPNLLGSVKADDFSDPHRLAIQTHQLHQDLAHSINPVMQMPYAVSPVERCAKIIVIDRECEAYPYATTTPPGINLLPVQN